MRTKTTRRRFSFSVRVVLLVTAVIAALLGLDQYIESSSRQFEKLAQESPKNLELEPYSMTGEPTIEIVGVHNVTTIMDRLFLRRRYRVHYGGFVQDGNTYYNVSGTPTYQMSLAGYRPVEEK